MKAFYLIIVNIEMLPEDFHGRGTVKSKPKLNINIYFCVSVWVKITLINWAVVEKEIGDVSD